MKIGYARVSTNKQDLSLQLDALKEYGCETIYEETGSGAKNDRPELINVLKALRVGDTLVVWKLDRLSRSIKDLINIVNDLNDRDIQFISITDNIETSTPSGKLIFHIFSALAEFERNIIRERTTAGLKAARARGRKGGRKPKLTMAQAKSIKTILDSPENDRSVEDIGKDYGVSRATVFRALDKLSSNSG
ncbi:MAG: DNA invertase [Verrucomicrobia bacterium CG_4_9_14_3_um_filter_43_20]|nr:MAG: DNA invertase [Verrucomicrobia bacterium CG_4_9_14_3_um_filter_43_20]